VAIVSFQCRETQDLFDGKRVRRFVNIEAAAMRKLAMLNRAATLDDLRVPPGNRLEALQGDRRGQHSIRINDQFRVCFVWTARGPRNVEIVDYH
jgi:proteic killer suppression protein